VVVVVNPESDPVPPTIDGRVRLFLDAGETTAEDVRDYVAQLLAVCDAQARDVRTQMRLMLLAGAAFLIFSRREVAEVAVLGVKINSYGLLHAAIPVTVLAMTLRILLTVRELEIDIHIFQKIVQHHRPGLFSSGLHDQLVTFTTPLSRRMGAIVRGTRYGIFFQRLGQGERYTLLGVGPLVFAGFAYAVLFATYPVTNAGVWLSAMIGPDGAHRIGRAARPRDRSL
jgi:hypothetical protein